MSAWLLVAPTFLLHQTALKHQIGMVRRNSGQRRRFWPFLIDYPQSVPYETIPSVVGFRLVLSEVLYAFLWHLYFLLMPKRKYQRKGQSYRQRLRPTGIALFLTGLGSFFGCCRRFSSCQKRRSLLRRDHSLRSGVPRGRPVPEQKNMLCDLKVRSNIRMLIFLIHRGSVRGCRNKISGTCGIQGNFEGLFLSKPKF